MIPTCWVQQKIHTKSKTYVRRDCDNYRKQQKGVPLYFYHTDVQPSNDFYSHFKLYE
jgi:hypothetical protein